MRLGHDLNGVDEYLPFGKSRNEHLMISELPDSYLRWLLEQDFFERDYPERIEPIQNLLNWREQMGIKITD